MYQRISQLEFIENGKLLTLQCSIHLLTREQGVELLLTTEGKRIYIDDLISMNGVAWNA